MFEFKKLYDAYEGLTSVEKGLLMTEKSVKILAKLACVDIPEVDPVSTLVGFIVGSVVADGRIDEQEYLLIYPSLVKTFGYDFDFYTIKQSFSTASAKKAIAEYTEEMLKVFERLDEDLKDDVIMLCLCVTSLDGKISLKEKRYVRKLCRA